MKLADGWGDSDYSSSGAPSIPLIVEGDKLFLDATLEVPAGKSVTHKLRIDTGSGHRLTTRS